MDIDNKLLGRLLTTCRRTDRCTLARDGEGGVPAAFAHSCEFRSIARQDISESDVYFVFNSISSAQTRIPPHLGVHLDALNRPAFPPWSRHSHRPHDTPIFGATTLKTRARTARQVYSFDLIDVKEERFSNRSTRTSLQRPRTGPPEHIPTRPLPKIPAPMTLLEGNLARRGSNNGTEYLPRTLPLAQPRGAALIGRGYA